MSTQDRTFDGELINSLITIVDNAVRADADPFIRRAMEHMNFLPPFEQLPWKDRQLVLWIAEVYRRQEAGQ